MVLRKHIAQTLLERAHPAQTASAIFTEKVVHKPLHLRPTSPDPTSQDSRAQRRLQRIRKQEKSKRQKKVKPLSAKEKRVQGIYDLPVDARKYEIYVPLHRMWLGYIWEILGVEEGQSVCITAQGKGSILASADYHGARVSVVKSRCAGMVGLEGIVVRDTKFTFQIITRKDELKTIPKKYTVFRFEIPQTKGTNDGDEELLNARKNTPQLPNLVFELHGSQFENRAPDRATKKFKQKHLTDL
ncbi:MAG: hypothetical protein Q9163_001954 [Psora crenata]